MLGGGAAFRFLPRLPTANSSIWSFLPGEERQLSYFLPMGMLGTRTTDQTVKQSKANIGTGLTDTPLIYDSKTTPFRNIPVALLPKPGPLHTDGPMCAFGASRIIEPVYSCDAC